MGLKTTDIGLQRVDAAFRVEGPLHFGKSVTFKYEGEVYMVVARTDDLAMGMFEFISGEFPQADGVQHVAVAAAARCHMLPKGK